MGALKGFFLAIGRVFLSAIFILSALNKMTHFQSAKSTLETTLHQWAPYGLEHPRIQSLLDKLLDATSILILLAILLELMGGVMVFLGYKPKLGASFLAIVLIPVTLVCHAFWLSQGAERDLQMVMFLKNLSILGGCFILAASASGGSSSKKSTKSVDA